MTENQIPAEETLEERFEYLAQELKDMGVPRELWMEIQTKAEEAKSVEELDAYLATVAAQF